MIFWLILETCQSGRMYLFAKEAGLLKGLASSNLAVSAKPKFHTFFRCGILCFKRFDGEIRKPD